MLHHRHPAVGGGSRHGGLALGDVLEAQLVILVGIGVDGRASEGAVELRLLDLAAVARQFQVQRRRDRRRAGVGHVEARIHHIAALVEDVSLHELHAVLLGGQHHFELVLAVQRTRTRRNREHRGVVGQVAADQARTRHVGAVGITFEQHDRLAVLLVVLEHLQAGQDAAGRVDLGTQVVGGDHHLLARGLGGGLRGSRHRARRRGTRGGRCVRLGHVALRRGAARAAGRGGLLRVGAREEHRRVAVGALPVVVEQHEGHREDDPQDGAFDIHVSLWSEEIRVSGAGP
ncbi:hypothetical protein D3C72_1289920 [compost metagenome]